MAALSSAVLGSARFFAIFCPTLFAGVTAQCKSDYMYLTKVKKQKLIPANRASDADSFILVDPIVAHAPNEKTMAMLWLHAYQLGPLWVPPLILPGTVSNAYLASLAPSGSWQRLFYLVAAGCIFGILVPITFFYMEPGINGACKWRVESLWKDEGFHLPETTLWKPSAHRHGGTARSRAWAEKSNMKELVLCWRKVNNLRWMLGGLAAFLSGIATFSRT